MGNAGRSRAWRSAAGWAAFYQPNASTQKRSTGGFPKLAS